MYLVTCDVIGNTFPVKNDESDLRLQYDVIWQHLLLKIAMTHPLSNLRVRTLTTNIGEVPPPQTCSGTYPPVNQTLSRHAVIWQPTVTIYSDDSCRVCLKTM